MKTKSPIPFIFAFLIVFMLSCDSQNSSETAQESNDLTQADIDIIKANYQETADGWNNGNRNPYIDRYSEDAIVMPPNQEMLEGKEAIRDYITTYPEILAEIPPVDIWGTATDANVRGVYNIKDPAGNPLDSGKYLDIWKKNSEGEWELTLTIYNSDIPIAVQDSTRVE